MSNARRILRVAIAFTLGVLLTGCLVIPYTPKAESRHDTAAIVHPEQLRLSVGPREYLSEFESDVVKRDARVQPVPGQTVIDIVSPQGELTLERLLDPVSRQRINSLQLDYVVILGNAVEKSENSQGGVMFYMGFFGLGKEESSTSLWTAIIDAKEQSLVRQTTSKATGTSTGVGLFYGLFIVSDDRKAAWRDAVDHVTETLAGARPGSSLRVAFLAVESIGDASLPTDGEMVAQRLPQTYPLFQQAARRSLDHYPLFQQTAAPLAGQGLAYIYIPTTEQLCLDEADLQAGLANAADDLSRLRCGSYYPYYLSAGSAMLGAVSHHADAASPLELRVREGESQYVRLQIDMKIGKHPAWKLGLVDEVVAATELSKCRRMPSAYDYDLETKRRAEAGEVYDQLELARLLAIGVRYVDGQSLPQDRIESYKWYSIVKGTGGGIGAFAAEQRGELAAGMDAAQIAEAKRRTEAWIEAFIPRGSEPIVP